MRPQDLERDDAVRVDVRRTIDDAHRAAAELLLDEVRAEHRADELVVGGIVTFAVGTDAPSRAFRIDERVAIEFVLRRASARHVVEVYNRTMSSPEPFRPGAVRTFGTLNLVFAGLGVLGLVMMYMMYFGGLELGDRNPTIEAAHQSPQYMSFMRASLVVDIAGVIVLALAGIGLLRMKMWGRKLSIAYAFYAIVRAVAGFVAAQRYLAALLQHSRIPRRRPASQAALSVR